MVFVAPAVGELDTGEAMLAAQQRVSGAALSAAQASVDSGAPLWFVVQHGEVSHGPLWGLGRVLALEHPEIWGGLIERDVSTPASAIIDAIAQRDEDMISLSGPERRVARLVRISARGQAFAIRGDGTYLVTGGYGALGLRVAEWLVERGARALVLVGRSAASPAVRERVRHLEQRGARVELVAADVAVTADVVRVIRDIHDAMPPLRGVIHCAGVLDDGIVMQQTWSRFERVMAPKIVGAWNLHLATSDASLDFFILFSSAAALLGSPGQSGYAAANAFLDALARARNARGLPAMSLAWGPWADGGMAASATAAHDEIVRHMAPDQAIYAMEQALGLSRAHIGIIDANFARWNAPRGARTAFISELLPTGEVEVAATTLSMDAFINEPAEQRPMILARLLGAELAKVLQASPESIDLDASVT
ncbi:MAG TPA: SDR family oxidoreductase, partial [Kofleriaceae bacterium]